QLVQPAQDFGALLAGPRPPRRLRHVGGGNRLAGLARAAIGQRREELPGRWIGDLERFPAGGAADPVLSDARGGGNEVGAFQAAGQAFVELGDLLAGAPSQARRGERRNPGATGLAPCAGGRIWLSCRRPRTKGDVMAGSGTLYEHYESDFGAMVSGSA